MHQWRILGLKAVRPAFTHFVIGALPLRSRLPNSRATLRHSRGSLSASAEKSGSVIHPTTESQVALTEADRGVSGSTTGISPTCSPAFFRATMRPSIITENTPLRIKKRSASDASCSIRFVSAGISSNLSSRAISAAQSWSRTRRCDCKASVKCSLPSEPWNRFNSDFLMSFPLPRPTVSSFERAEKKPGLL